MSMRKHVCVRRVHPGRVHPVRALSPRRAHVFTRVFDSCTPITSNVRVHPDV